MSKKCTPLWHEAHLQVKKPKKNTSFGALLEVEMSKKRTPLWHEAHSDVKMYKTAGIRTTFGRSDVVSLGRRKGLWTLSKVSKTWGFCSIYNYNHHYTTTATTPRLHSTTLHYITLHYTPLHSTTLHYTPLHYTTLHLTTLHSATVHYTKLHCTTTTTALHYINYIHNYNYIYNYNTLQNATLDYTTTTTALH